MENQEPKKYTGRGGWHGGGRPKKPESERTIYKTISIAGSIEEIESIKTKAKAAGKTTSRYLIDLACE